MLMPRDSCKIALVLALTATSGVIATDARGDGGSPTTLGPVSTVPECPPLAPRDHWYGWQIWLADAGAIAVAGPLTRIDGVGGRAAFFGAFVLEGPIVHLTHHRLGAAALSLFVRAWLPFLFVSTEMQYAGKTLKQLPVAVLEDIATGPVGSFYTGGLVLGGARTFETPRAVATVLGLATATAIDGIALAYEAPPKAVAPKTAFEWAPMPLSVPSLRPGGAPAVGFGVHGAF